MKQLFFILILVFSFTCMAGENVGEKHFPYNKTMDLYYDLMDLTFDCAIETGSVEFRYTEDYNRSRLEHYFMINYERMCFVEAEGKSIHDQVYSAVKSGLKDTEAIFKKIKTKKIMMKTVDCKELETSYWQFFKELKNSISIAENEYREAALPKVESAEGEIFSITTHPPIFDFKYGDYSQPKHSIHIAGFGNNLVSWADDTIRKLHACENH